MAGSQFRHAFTLIELMVVVGILGLIFAMGVPAIYQMTRKGSMRTAVEGVKDVCMHARARAIMSGRTTMVVFHPLERRLEISGGGGEAIKGEPPKTPGSTETSAQLAEEISIEMLDINLLEYRGSEEARVRFFPNGTSDEMTLVLRSPDNEWRALSLEITTGQLSVETDPQKFGK